MGNLRRYIVIVIFIIILLFLGKLLLSAIGGHKTVNLSTQPKLVHVSDFIDKSSSSVSWTQAGRVLGDDRRRNVKVTVSPTERKVELLEGYNQNATKTAVFSNNQAAYTNFLLALENLHFGQERKIKQIDERGVCPLGSRYIYEIHDGKDQKMRLWSDACASVDGNFAGVAVTTRQLFKEQITGYDKFVSGVSF